MGATVQGAVEQGTIVREWYAENIYSVNSTESKTKVPLWGKESIPGTEPGAE